jgi:O-antigen/teichoic acid export membrane protein
VRPDPLKSNVLLKGSMKDLKAKTIRGGAVRICALAGSTLLRLVSMMILARLLEPKDFGLVGMASAFTGVLFLFRDFGLSTATIQRATVTERQSSTLFWINFLLGAILALTTALLAPLVGDFYHEPRLLWVTRLLATGFLFNGAGVQHSALLQREMRFTALALIDIFSLIVSTAIAIFAALAGYGYWSLVAMTISYPLIGTICLWLATSWVPGLPRRRIGLRSIMHFGGTVTLTSLVLYVAFNLDKVLLGRFWGSEAIGIYGRAYQLIRIPTDSLNTTVGEVAFSALSRVQDDFGRLRRYFLKGYSLVLALTLPITVACGLFADDIVDVLLGPKWKAAAQIFRLLAPTILVFAISNPLGWLLTSLGLVGRGLRIALVLAPIMVAGYLIGLPAGATGIAVAYSGAMLLWMFPIITWAVHGTGISFRDVVLVVSRPLVSIAVAGVIAFVARQLYGQMMSVLPRLILESTVLFGIYFALLFFVAGQKDIFLDLIRGWRGSSATEPKSLGAPV